MNTAKDVGVRKISRISNGYGIFLTREVKKLGWTKDTFVSIRVDGDLIILKKINLA